MVFIFSHLFIQQIEETQIFDFMMIFMLLANIFFLSYKTLINDFAKVYLVLLIIQLKEIIY